MKKFKFNLQPLLEYRGMLEELARKDFVEVTERLREEECRLEEYMALYRRLSESLDGMKKEGIDVEELRFQHNYLNNLKEFIEAQKRLIAELSRQVEAKRLELVEARVDRKVMDRVKDRKEQEYHKDLQKEEQKITDEVAVNGFIRRGRQ